MLQAWQRRTQFGKHRGAVYVAPAVSHAVAGNQDLGFNLPEAVKHGVGTHVWRAHAPHRAQAHRRQKSHHGLGDVGQVGRHAVARHNALGLQVQRQRCDLLA